MRLGLSSYTYSWAVGVPGHMPARRMTALDLLARARSLGVRVVQIADNLPLDALSDAELAALDEQAKAAAIAIEVGTRGFAPDHLRRYIALAVRLGSPILRVVVDAPGHTASDDEIVATGRALLSEFEAAGVSLAIENHDRFRATDLVRILERLASPRVGICLDTTNSFGASEGPETVVAVLGPNTINLHVKDYTIARHGHKMGFTIEGRPAGQGQLPIPWLLDGLLRLGRDPNAILELWTPPEPALEATIAKEARWAEESVTYLRTLIPG